MEWSFIIQQALFGAAIGYVMQKNGFQEGLSCLDNLKLEAALCGLKGQTAYERITRCVTECKLEMFIYKRVSKCSAGMRGRLAIALALIPDPDLMLLDEAFSALDEESRLHIKSLLLAKKRAGTAMLMVSHNPEDFTALCERVLKFPNEEVVPL